MNFKLKRTTRTPYSEEISILDVDMRDANDEPVSIGKMDVHYVDDQIVGTLLIWQEYAGGYARTHPPEQGLDALIDAILVEVSEPVGISGTYAVEVFYPSTSSQAFFSNYPDEEEDEEAQEELTRNAGVPAPNWADETAEQGIDEEEPQEGDDFAERLRERPQ